MNSDTVQERSSYTAALTSADAEILGRRIDRATARMYFDAAERDTAVMRRVLKRDPSAARMHIADRATQGMDDGDALEIAYSYLYGDRS